MREERICFSLPVDYGESVEDLLRRGSYDWHDPKISSDKFPRRRCGRAEVHFELLPPRQLQGAPDIVSGIRSVGLEPAELQELLALGNHQPDMMYEFMTFAPGSSIGRFGRTRIPFLYSNYDAREVGLGFIGGHVSERWRFAGVRRIAITSEPVRSKGPGVLFQIPLTA